MANLLRDWLKNEITTEFREALEWRRSQYRLTQHTSGIKPDPDSADVEEDFDDEDDRFTFDGSNLRIHLTCAKGENKNVQIRSIKQDGSHHRCELSDGHHIVPAKLQDAASLLQADAGRPITMLQGAILGLKSYKLALTTFGDKDEHILLEVRDARYRKGSSTSGYFGHPKMLRHDPDIVKLCKTFAADLDRDMSEGMEDKLRAGPDVIEIDDEEADDLQSQGGCSSGSVSENLAPASQTSGPEVSMFATQFTPGARHNKVRPASPSGEVSISSGVNLARPEQPKRADDERNKLLALMSTKSKNTADPVSFVAPSVVNLDQLKEVINIEDTPADQHQVDRVDREKHSGAPVCSPQSVPDQGLVEKAREKNATSGISTNMSAATDTENKTKAVSKDDTNEAQSPDQVHGCRESPQGSTVSHYLPRTPDPLYMKYAQRRIPQSQRHLLQMKQSWFPPAPGETFPKPNVPIDTLKSLAARIADSKAARAMAIDTALPPEHVPVTDLSATKLTADVEMDETQDIPWSQSPPRPAANVAFEKVELPVLKLAKMLSAKNGDLPPDSSARDGSEVQNTSLKVSQLSDDDDDMPDDDSASNISESSLPGSRNDHDWDRQDADLQLAVPRTLGATIEPAPVQARAVLLSSSYSSAPATTSPVDTTIEVKESPLRTLDKGLSQSTGEVIPATQSSGTSGSRFQLVPNRDTTLPASATFTHAPIKYGPEATLSGRGSQLVPPDEMNQSNEIAARAQPCEVRSAANPIQSSPIVASASAVVASPVPLTKLSYGQPVSPPSNAGQVNQPNSAANRSKKRQMTGSQGDGDRRASPRNLWRDRSPPKGPKNPWRDERDQTSPREPRNPWRDQTSPREPRNPWRDRSPPTKKQRSNVVWGSQDIANEDPAISHQRHKRDNLRRLRHRVLEDEGDDDTCAKQSLDFESLDTGIDIDDHIDNVDKEEDKQIDTNMNSARSDVAVATRRRLHAQRSWSFGKGPTGDFARQYHSVHTVQLAQQECQLRSKLNVLSWRLGR